MSYDYDRQSGKTAVLSPNDFQKAGREVETAILKVLKKYGITKMNMDLRHYQDMMSALTFILTDPRVGKAAGKHVEAMVRPKVPPFSLAKAKRIDRDGQVMVDCPACGESFTVEPDAEYPCPSCRQGMLVSPLRLWGMI